MASPRRRGREIALQILFALDANPELDARAALAGFFNTLSDGEEPELGSLPRNDAADREFAESLVLGVAARRQEIDDLLGKVSRNWRVERMARLDRNVLRLALYELLHLPEVPARVTINEAIELVKRFGTGEASAFINGVLDSALKTLELRK